METVVRLSGLPEVGLERLVDLGIFSNKSDALRAGILELIQKYKVIDQQTILDELAVRKMERITQEIKEGKRELVSLSDVLKKAGINEADL